MVNKIFALFLLLKFQSITEGKAIWDSVPIVSQIKSLTEVINGDPAGAKKTQENFAFRNDLPVLSQLSSLSQVIAGDPEGAKKVQEDFLVRYLPIDSPLRILLQDAETLDFHKGDIIVCKINGVSRHSMLAVSDNEIAHVLIGNKNTDHAKLLKESWSSVTRNFKECGVATSYYDGKFSGSKNSPDETVKRALSDIRDRGSVYYDMYKCNSEHWVTYWKYGQAFSYQAEQLFMGKTEPKCPI